MSNQKSCIHCCEKVIGRADKKFCSMDCRSNFNNQRNRDANNVMRNVNRILRSNRSVLQQLKHSTNEMIRFEDLRNNGFNFSYFTNVQQTSAGPIQFCYELGLIAHAQDKYEIVDQVKANKRMEKVDVESARIFNMRPRVAMVID